MEKFTVSLDGIELYGYHGLYPGEKELGSKYKIDLSFDFLPTQKEELKLEDTIDYKKAYDIVVAVFEVPTQLLENICKSAATELKKAFPKALSIHISVSKFSPPLGGICEAAKVKYTLE
jgi:dihydroneopterin aldolase